MTHEKARQIAKDISYRVNEHNDAVFTIISGNMPSNALEQLKQFDEMPEFDFIDDPEDAVNQFYISARDLGHDECQLIGKYVGQTLLEYSKFAFTRFEVYKCPAFSKGEPKFSGAYPNPIAVLVDHNFDNCVGHVKIVRVRDGNKRESEITLEKFVSQHRFLIQPETKAPTT